jgi:dipeptidase E
MKFYLSSYKLGDRSKELREMIAGLNKKTTYISNALDFSSDLERREKSEAADIADLQSLGLEIEKVDLRDYFGKQNELKNKLDECNIIWVRGGNVFVLIQAMKLSGFDEIIKQLREKENIVYGAYSAGACVLAPTLRGLDLVDDSNIHPYPEQSETIWEGLNIFDYTIVPHYASDHDESDSVNDVINYMVENKILFKAIKDGEVIIF